MKRIKIGEEKGKELYKIELGKDSWQGMERTWYITNIRCVRGYGYVMMCEFSNGWPGDHGETYEWAYYAKKSTTWYAGWCQFMLDLANKVLEEEFNIKDFNLGGKK